MPGASALPPHPPCILVVSWSLCRKDSAALLPPHPPLALGHWGHVPLVWTEHTQAHAGSPHISAPLTSGPNGQHSWIQAKSPFAACWCLQCPGPASTAALTVSATGPALQGERMVLPTPPMPSLPCFPACSGTGPGEGCHLLCEYPQVSQVGAILGISPGEASVTERPWAPCPPCSVGEGPGSQKAVGSL